MMLWFLMLLSIIVVVEPQSTTRNPTANQTVNLFNQTDFQIAMDNMRASSYHGFVILLKILNGSPNSLRDGEFTFLMPSDEELSKVALRMDNLEDFVLGHSIPSALMISHLLHFPNGTLVPSGVPSRMLRITNGGRTGLFVNNARVVAPNVCLNSLTRCHGINAAMKFDRQNQLHHKFTDTPAIVDRKANSSSLQMATPALQ